MAEYKNGVLSFNQEEYGADLLQPGLRGMFGLQNKEEAVETILQNADYSTPEGRRAALEKIRSVDINAFHKYSEMNQKYETEELSLQEKQNKPKLERAWSSKGYTEALQLFTETQLGLSKEAAAQIKNDGDALKAIRTYATRMGQLDTNLVSDINSNLANFLKRSKEVYFRANAFTDFSEEGKTYGMPDTGYNTSNKAKRIEIKAGPGAGYQNIPGITQVDLESSGFSRNLQSERAHIDVLSKLRNIEHRLRPTLFGGLTLSAKEEAINERNKPAFQWFYTQGSAYFSKHPQLLEEASKDPLVWYEENIKGTTK